MFSAGHIVVMVTNCATKFTATCLPMIGQFFDTMIFASTDKEWLKPPSKIHVLESAGNSFEQPQRAEINLFIAILFFGILFNADQHFTKK